MKKIAIIFALLTLITLAGCGKTEEEGSYPTPDDFEPAYYLSENDLPENAYYITHKDVITDEKGNNVEVIKYFPLLQAEKTYTEKRTGKAGFDFSRVTWVNYNIDEGLIPTMYPGDELIYKSSTYIPVKYSLEKFFDNGYTFGVCGLKQDLSENYIYVSGKSDKGGSGRAMSTSDAAGFEGLEADSIYFVHVDDTYVTPLNVSMSGTITGLNLMQTYLCDIRTGTEKIAAHLCANIHYYSSAETYMFGSFTFITDVIARLNIPSYVTNGYYNINDGGFFRYIADENIKDWHDLTAEKSNDTIYTYSAEGTVNGTTIGLIFDENDFLVEKGLFDITDTSNIPVYGDYQTFEELYKAITEGIGVDKPTMLAKDGSYYTDIFTVDEITETIAVANYVIYRFTAHSATETLEFYYRTTSSGEIPVESNIYQIYFKDPSIGSIRQYIVSMLTEIRQDWSEVTEETEFPAEDTTEQNDLQ
ncbi:MAG: hypothetical protein IK121_01290 [Lachnospiraceae bacterium]|nr:hypothetical protein [Lachnospiraceae bacterium]